LALHTILYSVEERGIQPAGFFRFMMNWTGPWSFTVGKTRWERKSEFSKEYDAIMDEQASLGRVTQEYRHKQEV